jgi:histone-lysine N-methyltransferase SETD8
MPPKLKIPQADTNNDDGVFCCPVVGCGWSSQHRANYNRHYNNTHKKSYKFVCEDCTAGTNRRYMHTLHVVNCLGSQEANMQAGRLFTYVTQRQYRAAFPLPEEENRQEQDAIIEELETKNKQLKDQLRERDVQIEELKIALENALEHVIHQSPPPPQECVIAPTLGDSPPPTLGSSPPALADSSAPHLVEIVSPLDEEGDVNEVGEKEKQKTTREMSVEASGQGSRLEDRNISGSLPQSVSSRIIPVQEKTLVEGQLEDIRELEDTVYEQDLQPGVGEERDLLPPGDFLQLTSAEVENVDDLPLRRRSGRKCRITLRREHTESVEARLMEKDDTGTGLEIVSIPKKGRGVRAVRDFPRGEFILEYAGDLINSGTAKVKEVAYSMDITKGSYMYHFQHQGNKFCIDATEESGRYGRLLNHSRRTPNCFTKVVMLSNTPRLIFLAKDDIKAGQELTYDYGDRSKESLKAFPWLAL